MSSIKGRTSFVAAAALVLASGATTASAQVSDPGHAWVAGLSTTEPKAFPQRSTSIRGNAAVAWLDRFSSERRGVAPTSGMETDADASTAWLDTLSSLKLVHPSVTVTQLAASSAPAGQAARSTSVGDHGVRE